MIFGKQKGLFLTLLSRFSASGYSQRRCTSTPASLMQRRLSLALHVHRGFLSKTLRGVPQKVVITFGPLYPKFCIGSFCSNSSRWSDFEKKCKIIILSTRTSHKKWLGRGKVTKRWWWSYKSNDTYLNHCLITFVYLIRDIFVNQKKAYSSRRKYQSGKKKFCWIRGENIRTIRVSQA